MYRIQPGFVHRKIAGADVIIGIGKNVANFNGYMTLNETAAFLWDLLTEPREAEQLAQSLCDVYDIDYDEAMADVRSLLHAFVEQGMVQEVAE